jgi:hypothetical protein
MIQFNLLPDVKLQYLKAQRVKRLVSFIAILAGAVSLFVFLLALVTVDVVQKKNLRDLSADITTKSNQLKSVPNINKILTVQNQLNTLTSLHDQKAVVSRLFGYIAKVTPAQVTISNLEMDFTANTATISGEAPTLDGVNAYTDTLKATTYKATTDGDSPSTTSAKAFTDVVLASFGRDSKGATYQITLSFDPQIFSNANSSVTLSIPSGTVTNTTELFKQQASS